jgi:hypothetical protein
MIVAFIAQAGRCPGGCFESDGARSFSAAMTIPHTAIASPLRSTCRRIRPPSKGNKEALLNRWPQALVNKSCRPAQTLASRIVGPNKAVAAVANHGKVLPLRKINII